MIIGILFLKRGIYPSSGKPDSVSHQTFGLADGSHLSWSSVAAGLERPYLALHRIGVFPSARHRAVLRELLPHDFTLTRPNFWTGGMFLLHFPWASLMLLTFGCDSR